jgi:hypothetical protein
MDKAREAGAADTRIKPKKTSLKVEIALPSAI